MEATDRIVVLLQEAFTRLKKQNPRLSLRALATHLKLSSSYLSKVLRGERRLPVSLLGRLAKSLQLDHLEVAEIQRLLLQEVESREISPSTGIQTMGSKHAPGITDYASLGKPDLWLLDQWYYLPILNLVTTDRFRSAEIAARLGLKNAEAARALDRLVKAKYLWVDEAGNLKRTDLKFRFPTQRSHESVRNFHRTMIQKSLPVLAEPPTEEEFGERLISGITFAGDPTRVADAKVMIEEALYRAAEFLADGDCTEVFQLNLQLFKLTR